MIININNLFTLLSAATYTSDCNNVYFFAYFLCFCFTMQSNFFFKVNRIINYLYELIKLIKQIINSLNNYYYYYYKRKKN